MNALCGNLPCAAQVYGHSLGRNYVLSRQLFVVFGSDRMTARRTLRGEGGGWGVEEGGERKRNKCVSRPSSLLYLHGLGSNSS